VACQRQGALADRRSGGGADAGRGSLLDHLLVASLDRALALAQVHDVAERIAENLNLDVAAVLDVGLDKHRAVTERRGGLARRRLDRLREVGLAAHHPHAPAAAAGGGLDQRRHVNIVGHLLGRHLDDRRRRHAGLDRRPLGGHLVAQQGDLFGRRPHPDQPGGLDRPGEVGVLGEKPVAGVHGVAAGVERGLDDGVAPQVRLGRAGAAQSDGHVDRIAVQSVCIWVGVDTHRVDAQIPCGTGDAHGDLAPVGDE